MSRFDYVAYDEKAQTLQVFFKKEFVNIEMSMETWLLSGRSKALALTAIEEAYMWIGKAIRDDQIDRDYKTELQEERNNS